MPAVARTVFASIALNPVGCADCGWKIESVVEALRRALRRRTASAGKREP